ncbi:MAG: thioredoxin domain-containing protein [Patescibacteria group bacterium]|nr:thioredoxin domain-containing protein [Patescibacteria group bacterium]
MDQADKTRQIFLIGTIALGVLIVAGLIWAIAMGPGGGVGQVDSNVVFNDDGDPAVGPADAKVTVRIYSDFQCPACQAAELILNQVMQDYAGRVRFVWNDLPLTSLHANALPAAIAARCAQEQNKFWEYESALYRNQASWDSLAAPSEYFITLADQLSLQKDSFATCLSGDTPRMKVAQDVQEANAMGLEATPTFFVNRQKYEGVFDVQKWHQIIDAAIQ